MLHRDKPLYFSTRVRAANKIICVARRGRRKFYAADEMIANILEFPKSVVQRRYNHNVVGEMVGIFNI